MTLILTLLELDYRFKVHDLMYMDDFTMSRYIVECWINYEIWAYHFGTSTKEWEINGVLSLLWRFGRHGVLDPKYHRPSWGTLAGTPPQGLTDRDCPMGLWDAWFPRALRTGVKTFLLRFSSLKPLKFHVYFPNHLGSLVPSIPNRFDSKTT